MESSTRTQERFTRAEDRTPSADDAAQREPGREAAGGVPPRAPARPEMAASAPVAEMPSPLVSGVGDQCRECGARLASDQRYCIQCGARRGDARPPFGVAVETYVHEIDSAASAPRPRISVNATLIAAIGTLLLAMGVGVLIGRSSNNSSSSAKSPPVQVVTVAPNSGSGTAGTAASTPSTPATPSARPAGSTSSGKGSSGGKSSGAGRGGGAKPPSASKPAAPPPKSVTVGSKGSGAGYQNGKFTGNFFGG